jgi:VWFA-related protein
VAVALACIQALEAGQQPQPAAPPSLDASVDLVLVDMRVALGREPVTDLRPEDVTLLVDGAPRPVVSLIYSPVVLSSSAGAPPVAQPDTSGAGRTPPPRRLVFVVDRESLEAGQARQLQKTAEEFIERLPASVGVAVTTLPLGSGIRFEPNATATIQALRKAFEGTNKLGPALEAFAPFGCADAAASEGCVNQVIDPTVGPQSALSMNRQLEWQLRGRKTLNDLQWLFRTLAGTPSDVVVVSGALPYQPTLRAEIDRTFTVARTAGVRLHAIEAANLGRVVLPEGRDVRTPTPTVESLKEKHAAAYGLPDETGGIEASGSVSGADFFKELSRELASTYLLSFEPIPSDRDGQPHRIEVRTTRRPLPTIHARRTFIAAPRPNTSRTSAPRSAGSPGAPSPGPAAAPAHAPAVEAESTPAKVDPWAATDVAGSSSTVPLQGVMQRAAIYVDLFERTLSSLVAEERYVQVVKLWAGDEPSPGAEPELAWKTGTGQQRARGAYKVLRRRQLLSDLLLVQPPGQMWIGYRDVAEIDGKPVRDRVSRVEKLFLSQRTDSRAQLQRIADESARHNLGPSRNTNVPTFPLQLLRPGNLPRFEWTTKAQTREPTDPPGCAVVGFREVADPTIVKTNSGRNVPMTGQFCIEPATGQVWRATLEFKEPRENVDGAFMVTFRPTSDPSVLVPDRAWEWLRSSDPDWGNHATYVEGLATCSNLRRFTVNTEEQLK